MPHRYWRMNEEMGYAGTDSSETVDAMDYLGYSEEKFNSLTDEEVKAELSKIAWEQAVEKVEAWVEKIDEEDME